MSQLLQKIKNFDPKAARVFQDADLCTDSDLRSLTREDLRDLFPEKSDFKLRRTIFDIISTCKPVDELLKDLKAFIPNDVFREALSGNGALVDYLCKLKEMKSHVNYVQCFLEAHINLMEESRGAKPQQGSDKGCSSGTSNTGTHGSQEHHSGNQTTNSQQSQPRASVKYKKVISGKTFTADEQLMDKVKRGLEGVVRCVETGDDCEINLLFCPIISRIGTDVEAAMSLLKNDKPIILVLMHHAHTPLPTSVRTWSDDIKVVLQVSVFYHETSHGLLTCQQNDEAAQSIQKKLRDFIGQSDLAVRAGSHGTGSVGSVGSDRSVGSWAGGRFLGLFKS